MWLNQKVFTFKFEGAQTIQDDSFDSIKVKINENLTTIKLSQLFAKHDKPEFIEKNTKLKIKGWSILQSVANGLIQIGEKTEGETIIPIVSSISFESEQLGVVEIESIENPWFILNDIELSDEDLKSIDDKLLELSGLNAPVVDDAEQEEEPHPQPAVIVNSVYEKGKESFLKRGYTEFLKDNYRFLLLNKDDKFKASLIEFVDEKQLNQYNEVEKVTEKFFKVKLSDTLTAHIKTLDEGLFIEFVDIEPIEIKEEDDNLQDQK